MIKKTLSATALLSAAVIAGVYLTNDLNIYLFQKFSWALIAAFIVGTLTGIIRAKSKRADADKTAQANADKTARHSVDSFLEHWGTATGLFIMIISGFRLPGFNGLFMTNLHYLGLFYTLIFGSYFLADCLTSGKHESLLPDFDDIFGGTIRKYLLREPWKETGKYLSSQKSAFLTFVIIGSEVLISGGIKVAAKFWMFSPDIIRSSTLIHDVSAVFFVLMVLVHVLMTVAVRPHRQLIPAWFTGQKKEHVPGPEPEAELVSEVNQETADLHLNGPV
jgi:cytochrome b subunit of formate dehydrogenase